MSRNSQITMQTIGHASRNSFVQEALPAINKIISQRYVLGVYANLFDKSVSDVRRALRTPPFILFNTTNNFNVVVPRDVRIQDNRTNGWFWSGVSNNGQDWSQFINVNELYFPRSIATLDDTTKQKYTVYFITIVLHELAHWLRFKLEGGIPGNPNARKPDRESGENLELELLGGRMATYYFLSDGNEFRIDGVALLLLTERNQEQPIEESPCRILTKQYIDLFFRDMGQLRTEVQRMRMDTRPAAGLPNGASLKTPHCGCEDKGSGNGVDSAYEFAIARRPMNDKRG